MTITEDSEFGVNLFFLVREVRPKRILETGTYLGMGSTLTFAKIIRQLDLPCTVTSLEVNPLFASAAEANLKAADVPDGLVEIRHGLSIPASELPSVEKIKLEYKEIEGIPHDYPNAEDWAERYHDETFQRYTCDDLLREELVREPRPDIVLLDSAGHLGFREYHTFLQYAPSCWLALDDCNHIKHFRTFIDAMNRPEFTVRCVGGERNGWAILRYDKEKGKDGE